MLYMASEIFRLPAVAALYPGSEFWLAVHFHTTHVEWEWGSAWDLIQPSFMFMVGVALPWSVAGRRARGQGLRDLWAHAVFRALVLVLLGVFLRSVGRTMTNFTFVDVLTQIGLGYPILFWLAWRRPAVQAAAAGVILAGYWAAFALWPAAGPDWTSHWWKNANLAAWVDQWFLNLFPREKPFEFNPGGYATLNFVPSLATMIFGLLAGELLRGARSSREKLKWLVGAGLAGIAAGWLLGVTGVCPVVKRIWTPSWALFSGGWAALILAAFYWAADLRGKPGWGYALRAVGMNSIAMYCMSHLWSRFLADSVKTHLGWNVLKPAEGAWLAFAAYFAAWCFLWCVCVWMDRRKLYIRI
jgi:predicted acyltransferase